MAVKPIPDEYHTLTPYLYFDGASRAFDFYKKAFGAQELVRMPGPNNTIMHAEIKIGDSTVMLADNPQDAHMKSAFVMYVEDVDREFKRAVDAGATATSPVETKFYGDRMGTVTDPFGHVWFLATHVEDVSPEEMEKRSAQAAASMR